MSGKYASDCGQPVDPSVYADSGATIGPNRGDGSTGRIEHPSFFAEHERLIRVANAVRATQLRNLGAAAFGYLRAAAVGVLGGALGGYVTGLVREAKTEVKLVEKEVLRTVEVPKIINRDVPKYIDRPVEVPAVIKPFGSTCPACGNYHWAYPPGSTGQATGATKK